MLIDLDLLEPYTNEQDQQDAIGKSRTSLTPSLDFAVVSLTPRSESMTLV